MVNPERLKGSNYLRGVEAMAERIVAILREPILSRQMGEAGRRIAERHSHDRFGQSA